MGGGTWWHENGGTGTLLGYNGWGEKKLIAKTGGGTIECLVDEGSQLEKC